MTHGTLNTYTSHKCRCESCVATWRTYQKDWKATRLADPTTAHGLRVTYLCGCRCESCKAANAAYNMVRKGRLASSVVMPHGTTDGYGSYGCRCDVCTEAKAADTRDYYLRNHLMFQEKAYRRVRWINRDKREVTVKDIRRLMQRFDNRCAYCHADSKLELDHVVPLSKGGRHAIGNLLPCCVRCNRRKNAKFLSAWRYEVAA